ncbi:hypothetical protein NEFER03_1844 [Nematocida sp. LUAm3]|nr:hypothetical protein NEFER03_1844 [Nematocida sp. LUAm3]KAI5174006.1 hypothetical protein NEFER02_0473 [Nematocida sp. LUAm2]KAI5177250.1 hypothetical protein NEFER01_0525 [Nematocida sp. LUAm1]
MKKFLVVAFTPTILGILVHGKEEHLSSKKSISETRKVSSQDALEGHVSSSKKEEAPQSALSSEGSGMSLYNNDIFNSFFNSPSALEASDAEREGSVLQKSDENVLQAQKLIDNFTSLVSASHASDSSFTPEASKSKGSSSNIKNKSANKSADTSKNASKNTSKSNRSIIAPPKRKDRKRRSTKQQLKKESTPNIPHEKPESNSISSFSPSFIGNSPRNISSSLAEPKEGIELRRVNSKLDRVMNSIRTLSNQVSLLSHHDKNKRRILPRSEVPQKVSQKSSETAPKPAEASSAKKPLRRSKILSSASSLL